jgi:hypothetical protein
MPDLDAFLRGDELNKGTLSRASDAHYSNIYVFDADPLLGNGSIQ